MILSCVTQNNAYNITIERGSLNKVGELFDLNRRVCIVTDDGVPEQYARTVAASCKQPLIVTLPHGETSKTLANMEHICRQMLLADFSRKDCIVAVGGGVVGDMAGFAASCYMRGIDFYNVPTTLLSQVDSSIGGKTAVDLDGVKNIIGAFYQPRAVLIDPAVLSTLEPRQISNGMAEAIKMSVTSDRQLFSLLENKPFEDNIDQIIEMSLRVKRDVVQQDEKESGLRKVLNFGHTLGHGIETGSGLTELYHGECVALGMLAFCSTRVKAQLIPVLKKAGLPTEIAYDKERVWEAMCHDKKFNDNKATIIWVEHIGSFEIRELTLDELKTYLF